MKRLIPTFLAVCILSTLALTSPLQAQTPASQIMAQSSTTKVNPAALRELLVKGLKTTREDEKEYIDQVVARVVQKTLPVSIVYASFRYARARRPYYPFPYFVYSLETLEKRYREQHR